MCQLFEHCAPEFFLTCCDAVCTRIRSYVLECRAGMQSILLIPYNQPLIPHNQLTLIQVSSLGTLYRKGSAPFLGGDSFHPMICGIDKPLENFDLALQKRNQGNFAKHLAIDQIMNTHKIVLPYNTQSFGQMGINRLGLVKRIQSEQNINDMRLNRRSKHLQYSLFGTLTSIGVSSFHQS